MARRLQPRRLLCAPVLALAILSCCARLAVKPLLFASGRLATKDYPLKAGAAKVARRAGAASGVGGGGTTEIMKAAHDNDAAKVQELVKIAGADVNTQDTYGWTALRYAVRGNKAQAAEALIEAGADVNLASHSGRTPLMSAAGNRLSGMVRLLIKNGADKTLKDANEQTAYDLSLRGGQVSCTACQEMLYFEGAGVHNVPKVIINGD
mmetsp:Transcript_111830/g.315913  ORF Transcript_111830/g.315913 Transcript_111830/m.315913 type:complete len:208 (+) Transcript_111830:105-728(+)